MAVAKSCWQRNISLDQSMDATERPFGREPPLVAIFGIAICFALPVVYHCGEASIYNSNKEYNRPVPIERISINTLFVNCKQRSSRIRHLPIKKLQIIVVNVGLLDF